MAIAGMTTRRPAVTIVSSFAYFSSPPKEKNAPTKKSWIGVAAAAMPRSALSITGGNLNPVTMKNTPTADAMIKGCLRISRITLRMSIAVS